MMMMNTKGTTWIKIKISEKRRRRKTRIYMFVDEVEWDLLHLIILPDVVIIEILRVKRYHKLDRSKSFLTDPEKNTVTIISLSTVNVRISLQYIRFTG